ncbi:MAG: ABC transporter permease [Halanaerobiaceae bacterium]
MQVFKAFFKIIYKNLGQIIMYIVIFISLSIFLANTSNNTTDTNFSETSINLAFINNDSNSKIVEGLQDYLSENNNIVDLPDEKQEMQDALFFRKAEYIVKVPVGFTEAILQGKRPVLEKIAIPDSPKGVYIDNMINKYLNTTRIYLNNIDNLSQEQLISYINQDLNREVEVNLKTSVEEISNNEKRAYYFNYMAYSLLAVLILGISSVMIVFNDKDLKRRNLCSPVKLKNMNLQMILGYFILAITVWVILILMSFIMYGSYMFTANGLLLLLNSFIFTLSALSISYLIGNLVHSEAAMSAVANVAALGTSFISGVFVPQSLLGEKVIKIASFTPNYWYVKSNNSIVKMTDFSLESLTPVLVNMMIIIGFALAMLSITLMITKQKRASKS